MAFSRTLIIENLCKVDSQRESSTKTQVSQVKKNIIISKQKTKDKIMRMKIILIKIFKNKKYTQKKNYLVRKMIKQRNLMKWKLRGNLIKSQ